ncbi:MAG: carbon-nitrogen hydrolase family protein [Ghiorsea sp.]
MIAKSKITAACLQLCSSDNVVQNLDKITHLVSQHQENIDVLLLPENATLITQDKKLKHQAAQPEQYKKVFDIFAALAKQQKCWLIAGTLLIQDKQNSEKYFNHCPVFSPDGQLVTHYNKMHLFDVDLGSEYWLESASITAGDKPSMVDLNKDWRVGLSICYDVRFPELYRHYSSHGCNIMSVPAAFTVPTGKAHWHTLLKARAIENQSYVLAAAQCGTHQNGRKTYGYSLIIDPWGEVLAEQLEGEALITADLSLQYMQNIRKRMPALNHRRV